jgi:hypothetical protein
LIEISDPCLDPFTFTQRGEHYGKRKQMRSLAILHFHIR